MSWAALFVLLGLAMVQMPGCSCRAESAAERAARLAKEEAERLAEEEKRLEEERNRQPIVLDDPRMLPSRDEGLSLFAKPGHWNALAQPAKANANDFDGMLTYGITPSRVQNANPPLLVSRRPLVVARESEKAVESLFYCPIYDTGAPVLKRTVRGRRDGLTIPVPDTPLRPLLGHQYHFVVLAKEPIRYAFLDALRSVTAPLEPTIDTTDARPTENALPPEKNYRVVAVSIDAPSGEIGLPDSPLAWTSIAYLLWDEVDPESLRPAQRDALVDWINWGGQLIINGPDSLALLRDSFLEPLLPATEDGAREIPASEIALLERVWDSSEKKRGRGLSTARPWTGVRLKPAAESIAPRGLVDLMLERRVGRGRIVVSGFQLADQRLVAWSRGVENLFNNVVLRRPPREFIPGESTIRESGEEQVSAAVRWAEGKSRVRIDPRLNTSLRYFVRDTHANPNRLAFGLANDGATTPAGGQFGGGFGGGLGRAGGFVPDDGDWRRLLPPALPGGIGAIDNFNLAANQARDSLRASAGVSVPGADFVIACLVAYLFFLVPANWAFFAALRRVELAWVAAPLISLAGAWVVIQQAQLDIGFVRSRIEVSVLELQPDTPRGMLTRFTALYTSLSTTYDLEFENDAVATPFPNGPEDGVDRFGDGRAVAYERLEKSRLRDLIVSSASTELVRSDEILDIGQQGVAGTSVPGSIRLERGVGSGERIENRTAWRLEDVVVVERIDDDEPELRGCWIGDLEPGGVAHVAFDTLPDARLEDLEEGEDPSNDLPFQQERDDAARIRDTNRDPELLNIDGLLRLALDPARYERGERRVIARVSQLMPGLSIEPRASQRQGATLIVGHLGYGLPPAPKADLNSPLDIGG